VWLNEKTTERLEKHGIKTILDMKMKTASEISTWYHRVSVNALKE
jgi:hypothetical protein